VELDVHHVLGCRAVVEIREGERIAEGERSVRLLADLEQIAIAEVRSRPYCDDIPPPHVHPHHADVTYVIEGELELRLEDRVLRIGPDTWALIPPGVAHTIVVTEAAHTLVLHVPGSGYGDLVRGLHTAQGEDELRAVLAAFDQQPAPEGGAADPGLVVIARGGGEEGETIGRRSPDRRATLLVDAEEVTVTEFAYGPGQRGADLHVHHTHADAFLVVEGELVFGYRDGTFAAPAGTLVVLPPNVVHGFDNGAVSSRFFNLHMPASGFADYMRGQNPGFDQHDPPEDGGRDPAAVVVTRLSE
jgi:quercetin dioxygenase-like cupin family protein